MLEIDAKYIVIINERYKILGQQKELISELSGGYWEKFGVPKNGLSIDFQRDIVRSALPDQTFIFITMVPFLLASISKSPSSVYIMHNDQMYSNREKITLTNGRTVYRMPEDGWQLIPIIHPVDENA